MRLGDGRIGELRQPGERDGQEVLGRRLLLGRDALDAAEVDGQRGVVGLGRHDGVGVRVVAGLVARGCAPRRLSSPWPPAWLWLPAESIPGTRQRRHDDRGAHR